MEQQGDRSSRGGRILALKVRGTASNGKTGLRKGALFGGPDGRKKVKTDQRGAPTEVPDSLSNAKYRAGDESGRRSAKKRLTLIPVLTTVITIS